MRRKRGGGQRERREWEGRTRSVGGGSSEGICPTLVSLMKPKCPESVLNHWRLTQTTLRSVCVDLSRLRSGLTHPGRCLREGYAARLLDVTRSLLYAACVRDVLSKNRLLQ